MENGPFEDVFVTGGYLNFGTLVASGICEDRKGSDPTNEGFKLS